MHIEINACTEGTGIPLTSPSPAWLHLQTFIDFYPKIIYADFRTYEAQALTFSSTFRLTTVTVTVTITITVIVLSFFSSLLCPLLTLPQFPAVRPFLRMKPPFVELMGPRVQKVLPTVLISHNYTITKRKVFQHTPRLPLCPSPLGTPRTMPTARHGNEHSKKNAGKMKILFLPATKLKCSGKNSRYMYMKPKKRDI